jgi:RNA polymerase sigma-70 factor, ECF subfamily
MRTRTNSEWLIELQSDGPRQAPAITDLRGHLSRATDFYLQRRDSHLRGLDETERRQLAEDIVQDALLRVLNHLDSFRGESRFTTWAGKFAVHAAAAELRRARWRNVSLDATPDNADEGELGRDQAWTAVRNALDYDLTARQREAIMAVVIDGRPVAEVAGKLSTSQNALYKLVFDARVRLRRALSSYGWTVSDVLDQFDPACATC